MQACKMKRIIYFRMMKTLCKCAPFRFNYPKQTPRDGIRVEMDNKKLKFIF